MRAGVVKAKELRTRKWWDRARHDDPVLRWVCALCYLPNAEHRNQFWGCSGRWLSRW